MRHLTSFLLLLAVSGSLAAGAAKPGRYALILDEPPLAEQAAEDSKLGVRGALADRQRLIESEQRHLQGYLADRSIRVTTTTQVLLNAVYVVASPEQASELRRLQGVARVVELSPVKRHLMKATELVRAPQAWNLLNGAANAGTGIKIAILDTGIDHTHPGMQDRSLAPPVGYPKCRGSDCDYTNSKVIVARSYVDLLVYFGHDGDPAWSRPDDLSPRDRVGHGTAAAMVAAGARHDSPLGALSGVAPKAFLGSYKIFGSPGVNDVTFDDAIIKALEDAANDGMDVALLAVGSPALWSPSDRGAVCRNPATVACDPRAEAVENAVRQKGLTVVVSAGNDGDLGVYAPTFNSVHSPGTAPSAITVGASTNANRYFYRLLVEAPSAPADVRPAPALYGDGPRPASPLRAPLRYVTVLQDDGKACAPLGNTTLTGTIAVVDRGDCPFVTKVFNAQRAGAVGVVIVNRGEGDFLFRPTGLAETAVPAMMISGRAGAVLKTFLASNPDTPAVMDTALTPLAQQPNLMAYFSSYGPSIGEGAIKPELVAPGDQHYTATQSYDPNGDMYSADRYIGIQGTSFSAPMVAGAAALVKQRFSRATAAQIKSAVVNTASNDVLDYDAQGQTFPADVLAAGAGKLNVEDAVRTNLTAEPATLSFGVIGTPATLPSRGLRISNIGNADVSVQLEVRSLVNDRNARVVLDATSFTLAAGQSRQLTARLDGSRPQPGAYHGFVLVRGGAVSLRVPYLYLVGDGVPDNLVPLRGMDFVGEVNQPVPGRLALKAIDKFGVPVQGVQVQFRPPSHIEVATDRTDELGIVEARALLGPAYGYQSFSAETGSLQLYFDGRARLVPVIATDGVVNAASGRVQDLPAQGSYATIYGRNLSESLRVYITSYLPLSLSGVSVSFDVPSRRLSVPGRLHFVSEGQINVQVPWELADLNDAILKVSIGDSSSQLYTVRLRRHSPAFFEYTEEASGRRLIAGLDAGNRLLGTTNPARKGRVVQLYYNGGGPVDSPQVSGDPAPSGRLVRTQSQPQVTVGGQQARVDFSGLAPGFVGLYQLNIEVPPNAPTGLQQVVITMGGETSKAALLPVE